MADQTQRLEIATVKAEIGSDILSRFSNDALGAIPIPTESGDIQNLKQIIKSVEEKASVSTSIYPEVAQGLAGTAEGGMFLVASAENDEIYIVWRKLSGAAVDTGKRALSSQAIEDAMVEAGESAEAAAASALEAQESASELASAVKLIDSAAKLYEAFPDGGSLYLRDGVYVITEPLVVDYATPNSNGQETSFGGYLSKRYNLQGQSEGNTILLANGVVGHAVQMLGSFPVTQNLHGYDKISDLTISNPDRVSPNNDNSGMSGILLKTKAYTRVSNYAARNLATGLTLDGVLTSTLEDITIEGCYQGIVGQNSLGVSGPNATHWSRVKVGLSTSNGIVTDVGAAQHFNTVTVEGCGTFEEGSQTCGMVMRIPADQIGANVVLTCPYFELNKGLADLYIDNQSTHQATVTIVGGFFARAGSEYTQCNIQAHSSGGGQLTVLVKGVGFRSLSGYTPSNVRPFTKAGENCHIIPDENCTYNETISLAGDRKQSAVCGAVIDALGNRLAGDSSISTARLSLGTYRFASAGFFGVDSLSYVAVGNGCDSTSTGFGSVSYCRFQPVSGSQFIMQTFNQAGALVDGPIAVMISSLRGGL